MILPLAGAAVFGAGADSFFFGFHAGFAGALVGVLTARDAGFAFAAASQPVRGFGDEDEPLPVVAPAALASALPFFGDRPWFLDFAAPPVSGIHPCFHF